MKRLSTLFFFLCLTALAQVPPVNRNSWSTNIPPNAVWGQNNLSVTNAGTGTNWLFWGIRSNTVARLMDITASTNAAIVVAGSNGIIVLTNLPLYTVSYSGSSSNVTINGLTVNGVLAATNIQGNGYGLTNLSMSSITNPTVVIKGSNGISILTNGSAYTVSFNGSATNLLYDQIPSGIESTNTMLKNVYVVGGGGASPAVDHSVQSDSSLFAGSATEAGALSDGIGGQIGWSGLGGIQQYINDATNNVFWMYENHQVISIDIDGTVTANNFIGSGSGLTNVPSATSAVYVTTAILTNQSYASNILSGGQLPLATISTGLSAVAGPFLTTNGANISYSYNGNLLTNLNPGFLTAGAITNTTTYTTATSFAPAGDELANASWVRGLFDGAGVTYYSTPYANASFTNADIVTTNVTVFEFNLVAPAYGFRKYVAPTNACYIGQITTTNKLLQLNASVTVNAYLEAQNGSGTGGPRVKPEIYVSYDGTNWFGDWDAAVQFIPEGATNLYSWVVSNPSYTTTNATGFYVQRRFKIVTQTSPVASDVIFHYGTNRASHISLSGSSVSSGNAFLAVDQTFTGTNTFTKNVVMNGGQFIGNGGGLTNLRNARFAPYQIFGTNITLYATNGNYQAWVLTNNSWLTLSAADTNYAESIRIDITPGASALVWDAGLSNVAQLTLTNYARNVFLIDHAFMTNLWWGFRMP